MGKGEWSNPDGCGQGEGELHLRCTYTPFDKMARHPSQSVTVSFSVLPLFARLSCDIAALQLCTEVLLLDELRLFVYPPE